MKSWNRTGLICWIGLLSSVALVGCAEFGSQEPEFTAVSPDDRYIVHFHQGVTRSRSHQVVDLVGGTIVRDLPQHGIAAITVAEAELINLQEDPRVAFVEVDERRHLMAQVSPYGIAMVQADQVPAVPTDGDTGRVTVCIIDSGIARGHPDLFRTANIDGTNVNGSGNWFNDGLGHGTHVAGTIAALNNTYGVIGVGPDAIRLHIIRVFDGNGGWSYSSDVIGALDECVAANADVVSMSLGGGGGTNAGENAFTSALNGGTLSVAAAGNDGNTQRSFPASFAAVISVAALTSTMGLAEFSQRNSAVELAAPGVNVLSTMPPGTGRIAEATVGSDVYEATGMEGSPDGTATGQLVDCGLAMTDCPGGGGHICLILRGDNTFADKVTKCENGGGIGAIVYNNIPGGFSGTLGGTASGILSAGVSDTAGALLVAQLGQTATLTLAVSDYGLMSGTSMATPHVSAVAALVWSQNNAWTAVEIRAALQVTALDLGAAGRDNSFGFGLVQARAALDLLGNGCPNDPNKTTPGVCGCGTPDTDTDGDGTADCIDNCVADPDKSEPGICGCGTSDADTDDDGTVDCEDLCPNDASKIEPGTCGCGISDGDSDGDGSIDCEDPCPFDRDDDADGDGVCGDTDNCPMDSNSDQADDNNNGVGDACETGDGGGCGCTVGGTTSGLPGGALLVLLLGVFLLIGRVPGLRLR